MTLKRKGGRPPGTKGHRNKGLFKKCGCRRRDWWTCAHPVYMNYRSVRINLNLHAKLPPGTKLSRTEAEVLRANIVKEISEGTFNRESVAAATDKLTLRDVADRYLEDFKSDPNRRSHRAKKLDLQLALICRTEIPGANGLRVPMGQKPFQDFVLGDIEGFRDARRRLMQEREKARKERLEKVGTTETPDDKKQRLSTERPGKRQGEIGINRHLEMLRHLFNYGIRKGFYAKENPFLRLGQRLMAFAPEKARSRRLQGDEEARLLKHAGTHLQALIIAAVETGCRKEELLSLQWKDVKADGRGQARFLILRAENTKTDEPRTMPVSPRLRAVLEMRRTDPDGEDLGPDTHVFGNEVGERQDSIKVAWTGTLQRAGISGLTFHDLRREYGSRLVEGGVNLLTVSRLLGHARVSTTDTYLRASELLAEKELQQFHERADRNNPRITPRRKSKPPVEGKARPEKTQKSSTSRSVS